jgi:DNA-binding NarL/FixJ family response regulator
MKKKNPIRLLVVDDHFFVRMGLSGSLNSEHDMTVVAEADNGRQAIEKFRQHRPDVVIMDGRLPGMSGAETVQALRREFPEARVLMLSIDEAEEDVYRAIQAGAAGYLAKAVQLRELLQAVRAVHAGERYLPPSISARLASRVTHDPLSARELEVLHLIVAGRSNKEIGAQLNIAETTVKLHVRSLLAKLGVSDRTQATTEALRRGLVHLS